MNLPPSVVVVLAVTVLGAALALAGFVWAVGTGQLDPSNDGAKLIFEDREPGED